MKICLRKMKRRNGKHASQSVARHFRQAYSQLVYVNRFFLNRKHFMMQCGTLFFRLVSFVLAALICQFKKV